MNLERISDVPRAGVNGCQEKTFLRRNILTVLRMVAKASASLQSEAK